MQKYNWNYPTTIWLGENRINDIAQACKSLNIKKREYVEKLPCLKGISLHKNCRIILG